jgi:hypothetical protein
MDILKEANKILRVWTVKDIQNFIPDILLEYCKIDQNAIELEKQYELARIEMYVKLKKEKKEWKNKYSDKDIDVMSKRCSLEKYWDYSVNKKIAWHYKMYIQALWQKKIDLQVLNKSMKEWIGS